MPTAGRHLTGHAVRLDGAVYAAPIVVRGVVVVATEHNVVYGLSVSGRRLWQVDLGGPAPSSQLPCGNIDPLGITGTPVFDSGSGLVYLVTELGGPPRHRLVALDPANGAARWRVSVDLPGVSAAAMQQRGALTVAGGRVWVPFGGLDGDCSNYKGRVVGVPVIGTHAPKAFTVPTAREGGIWTPPGPSVDAAGHLFVSVGNGASGSSGPYDHSDSVLKLAGTSIVDSFSPSTWRTDNDGDKDLGSQGPALVGSQWVFIAGKSGTAYVLDQRHLGGIGGEVSARYLCRSFGGTAVSGNVVYVPCEDGVRAVRISSSGHLSVLWQAASGTTGSPVLGGGLLWSLDPDAGVLHGLDPASGRSRVDTRVGVTSRFATPALWGRDVIVPTMAGVTFVRTS
jgi:PQQ-like domain